MWELVKDEGVSNKEKYNLLIDFDKVFSLGLDKVKKVEIPAEVKRLAGEREKCRLKKDWQRADELRKKIENLGYQIEDTAKGPKIHPIK